MISSNRYIDADWQYRKIQGASHWFMLERPNEVNRYLLDFLAT